jgi:hypothetical protein
METKTFYLQLDQENIVRDVIEMPYKGYVPLDLPLPLPVGINAGWYRCDYVEGTITLDEDLRNRDISVIIERERKQAEDALLNELIERGVL